MSKQNEVKDRKQFMDPGAVGLAIGEFTRDLAALGHTRLTVIDYERSARHFAEWLHRSKISLVVVDEQIMKRFARHRCQCSGSRRHDRLSVKYVHRVNRFVHFLRDRGLVKMSAAVVSPAVTDRVADFQAWLRRHRGISERTIDRHGRMIMRLLPTLGDDPAAYDPALVRKAIIDEAQQVSRPYVKTMAMALRGYLRFLAARGFCRSGLDQAIPPIPQWRLSALPRYISVEYVDRLITSCDLVTPQGVRDRAILLLLARLGLRGGDILGMRLDDIVWHEGTLRVRGKGRREIRLPLAQDAGDALLAYLQNARPSISCDRIFLTSKAPYRPLGSSTISNVVRLALERAGIDDAPSHGANLLRHSAATSMLRAGATLDTIGAVLRHRSMDTTAHYAKVDVDMLRLVAQPWLGVTSC